MALVLCGSLKIRSAVESDPTWTKTARLIAGSIGSLNNNLIWLGDFATLLPFAGVDDIGAARVVSGYSDSEEQP